MPVRDTWSPEQYARFREARSQPFHDLLALVEPRPGMRVVDLGCGTGELTAALHERLAARETLGVDSSEAMLAKSRSVTAPGLRFARGDIAEIGAGDTGPVWDLVFSNAALHWVADHPTLLARLTATLAPAGQLAVQVPANHDHSSHLEAAEVAATEPFRDALGGYVHTVRVLAPEAYAALLDGLGYARQQVRLQVYGTRLAASEEVVEWTRGTLLTDYERRMPPDLWPEFLAAYRARLLARIGTARPYFFAFKRILMWGARAARRADRR